MIRVAIYLRVSSRAQTRGVSLSDQEQQCRNFAAREDWVVVEVYADRGLSGRKDNRPALKQMIADSKRFDVVLFYKINRLGRNLADSYRIAADVERSGVRLASATESFDRKTAAGKLTFGMLSLVAQFESDQLSEKMRDTRAAEAKMGRWVGGVPVGYLRKEGKLYPDPVRRAAVEMWATLRAKGDRGAIKIAQALNDAGYSLPSGAPFTKSQVEVMDECVAYAGHVECNGEIILNAHEPLVDAALWARIQEVAVLRGSRKMVATTKRYHLLSGLALCPCCGAAMWEEKQHMSYRSYTCKSAIGGRAGPYSEHLSCPGAFATGVTVDAAVLALCKALALTPNLINRTRELLAAEHPSDAPRQNQAAELRKLRQHFLDERITIDEYQTRERELREAPIPVVRRPRVDPDRVAVLLSDMPRLLEQSSPQHQQAIVRALLAGVYVRWESVYALAPTQTAAPLWEAAVEMWQSVLTAGRSGGSGGHLHPIHTIG